MTRPRTLAVFAASSCRGGDALEFLRVVAALAACGHGVDFVAAGEGVAALASEDVPDDVDRYLESLAAVGIAPRALAPAQLAHAANACAALLRFGDPSRPADPPLLEWSPGAAVDAGASLIEAGQVIHVADARA
ncbi:MAG: hypothetical protein ACYTG6_08965 [Planctomycetota bacterium]